jgi:hypothetical protein
MSTAGGQIRPLTRERRLDRRAERVATAWIGGERPMNFGDVEAPLCLERPGRTIEIPRTEKTALVIAGEPGSSSGVRFATGSRVYVLAPPEWSEKEISGLAEPARARVLARRLPERFVGSALLIEGTGYVWIEAQNAAGGRWRITLDPEQLSALREIFLYLFWHRAVDEAWDGGSFRPCATRPFEVPRPAAGAIGLREGAPNTDFGEAGSLIFRPGGAPPHGTWSRAWTPPSGADHAALARMRADGTEVVWGALGLPACWVNGHRGELAPSSERWSLPIALNAAQRAILGRLLRQEPAWRFEIDRRLDTIAGDAEVWLSGAPRPERTAREIGLAAPPVRAGALSTCASTEPASWPEPPPLASSVVWR